VAAGGVESVGRTVLQGFTRVEVLTLAGIMAVLVALVIVLMPQPVVHVEIKEVNLGAPAEGPNEITFSPDSFTFAPKSLTIAPESVTFTPPREENVHVPRSPTGLKAMKVECMSNVRNIVGLLEFGAKYPVQSGPNLILYLVKKREIEGEDRLGLLFCPGDKNESLAKAGGVDAYYDIDLTRQGEYGHMTSYAGRNQFDKENAARKQSPRTFVLVCDDSEDHHDGRGFVVGLNGGAAKWRDKVNDWDLSRDTKVTVGEDSVVEELRCLRTE
jgi:hypothetical protein